MKKRYLVAFLICMIALILYSRRENKVLLADIYPAIVNGEYHATIVWDGQPRDGGKYEVVASNEEFRSIFAATRVTKHAKSMQMPSVAFDIRLVDNHVTYSIVVGGDNSISVAQIENLNQTRTYWTDCDEQIFYRLYTCYLNNGGTDIPEIETYLLEN